MADTIHVEMLKKGAEHWNSWRKDQPYVQPDFNGADLSGLILAEARLANADFRNCNLDGTVLAHANLNLADLSHSTLRHASLLNANLMMSKLIGVNLSDSNAPASFYRADLTDAIIQRAFIQQANFDYAVMNGADLSNAYAHRSTFFEAQLVGANLRDMDLSFANLARANLTNADLTGANLLVANLVETQLSSADLTGAQVYGISAWDSKLTAAIQRDLVITRPSQPKITVDNLEVAQFIYLLLNNTRVREVLDTITSKLVLILGRFTEERKEVLDAIREELRGRNYLPVLFDFEGPNNIDTTDTILILARMARFIIADLTDPKSIGHELGHIVPSTRVAIQPLLLKGQNTYSMFSDLARGRNYILPVYEYENLPDLCANLNAKVIAPAEECVSALRFRDD